MFSLVYPLMLVGLVLVVLTITIRAERRRSPQTLSERANHPLRQFQIALNAPRKEAQRAARQREAQPAAEPDAKPERPPRSRPPWLKQV